MMIQEYKPHIRLRTKAGYELLENTRYDRYEIHEKGKRLFIYPDMEDAIRDFERLVAYKNNNMPRPEMTCVR